MTDKRWISVGPAGVRQGQTPFRALVSGRVRGIAIAADSSSNRIYVAAANGGVWCSDDEGKSWRSLMDAFDLNPLSHKSDTLACGAIAVSPGSSANKDQIFVGSGEGGGGEYNGVGAIVSSDGGQNWQTETSTPPLFGNSFYELAIDPANRQQVLAATSNGLYLRLSDGRGGYRWQQQSVIASNPSRAFTSVIAVQSSNGSTSFYAIPTNGVPYQSSDGTTWQALQTGFPTSDVGRASLGFSENNPKVIYALVSNWSGNLLGVWRIDMAHKAPSWQQIADVPPVFTSQGMYDQAIAVAPDDENLIYLGGQLNPRAILKYDWAGAVYRCKVEPTSSRVVDKDFISRSVHADIHVLLFTPNDPNKLWVGCDGGVYFTDQAKEADSTKLETLFESRNVGLATMTVNNLSQHPDQDAVIFAQTQDNGSQRYNGGPTWVYSSGGDSGFGVVNKTDPNKVLNTYILFQIKHSETAGRRYSYRSTSVTSSGFTLFYSPLIGTPLGGPHPDRVAFGSQRAWISENFSDPATHDWVSIPNNTTTDNVNGLIRSLAFASDNKLYVGTTKGYVYRYDNIRRVGGRVTSNPPLEISNTLSLPLPGNSARGSVTSIAIDPSDSTGNSIYITFGGHGDWNRVWHYDGSQWTSASGEPLSANSRLLDVQHNAIVVDPENPDHLYVGADIGIWRSTDKGKNWEPFSRGLPDAAVVNLDVFPPLGQNGGVGSGRNTHASTSRFLRAATHGRGIFELALGDQIQEKVHLFVRKTVLDRGFYDVKVGADDPIELGRIVEIQDGVDIKLSLPLASTASSSQQARVSNGGFLFSSEIDFYQFSQLPDKSALLFQEDWSSAFADAVVGGNSSVIEATFTTNGYPLAAGYRLVNKKEEWEIIDGSNSYVVRPTDNFLNVYQLNIDTLTQPREKGRVYIQAQNWGEEAPKGVRVTLLQAELSAAGVPPQLPADLGNIAKTGSVSHNDWSLVGSQTIAPAIVASLPKVSGFDVNIDTASSTGSQFCLLAILDHPNDHGFNLGTLNTLDACRVNRKMAIKYLPVKLTSPDPTRYLAGEQVQVKVNGNWVVAIYHGYMSEHLSNGGKIHKVYMDVNGQRQYLGFSESDTKPYP